MTVDAAMLDRCLQQLRAEAEDPVAGLYGPRSVIWRIAREKVVFVGGGCAALLQLAHPYVGEAVARHSAATSDPLGRFERTFQAVYAMVFGDLDHAVGAARRVYAVHTGIEGRIPVDAGRFGAGHPYQARDEAATRWVFATLIHGSVQAWELVIGPLSAADKEAYWQDSCRFALLFGLTAADLPPTWPAFVAWWDDAVASDMLAVTPAAADVGRRLLQAPNRTLVPFYRSYAAVTAALMPSHLREPFGLPYGPAERVLARATIRAARLTYSRIPARVRCVPAYHEARRRMHGRHEPDRFGRALERVVLNTLLASPPDQEGATR